MGTRSLRPNPATGQYENVPVMVPGPGTCFRRAIVERLARLPHFDLGVDRPYLPDDAWERYKMQLVIGGTGGWTDRMRAFVFMTSVTVLIDPGT